MALVLHLLCVVLSLLDEELLEYFDLVHIVLDLPVDEVNFLQQLVLMKLQFTNHFSNPNSDSIST